MATYILRRLLSGLVTVFLIGTITFCAMHLVPGDPLAGEKATTAEIREQLRREHGLDKPLLEQYRIFLWNTVHGNFGVSYTQQNRQVNDIIRSHFPVSAQLGLLAVFMATISGVIFGSISALFRGKLPDRLVMFLAIIGISVPNFVFAAFAQYGVTERYKATGREFLPVAGWGELSHMVLPAIALELLTLALLARLMRSSMLEVVHQDYIRTAKAKGLSRIRIFFFHQFKNSILPVVTYLGPTIAVVTTGGFVVESVFAIPGLGRYFVEAVAQLDYTVIMGLTIFYGTFLVFMAVVVDILYGLIDPRIRIRGAKA